MAKEQIHLILPDSHAHPDFSNERYEWFAHLANDLRHQGNLTIIDIGDFFDMPSLCSYDRGKKSFEGRRYTRDIEAGLDAQDRIRTIIQKQKKKMPRFVRCLGNHEDRINRAVEESAVLDGVISTKDLQSKAYGWEEYPFLEKVNVHGVNYTHYATSGIMNRPIGGEHHAYSLLMKEHVSTTVGHSHLKDFAIRKAGNKFIQGLVVGVYQDYQADYAGPANDLWHKGVAICRGVEDGMYDLEFVSTKRMKEIYGKK